MSEIVHPLGVTPVGRADIYDEQPPLTELQRVTNTFVAPTKTFADIRRNKSWWLPFVVVLVFSYLFSAVALNHVGARRLADGAMRNNPAQAAKMQEATPEQRAQMVRMGGVGTQITLLSWVLTVPLFCSIAALLLWVGFNFILGGSGSYAGMFAVAMFASLPGVLRSLALMGVMYAGDPDNLNINDPIGTNPGFFMGAGSSVFLKTALSSVDVFTLWTLALMAIGAAIVARVKVSSGVAMVFTVWLIFVLLKAAAVAAMS